MVEGSSGERVGEQERALQQLVDAAEAFGKSLDLKRNPAAHIAAALRGVKEGAERDRLFGAVRREINKRERERRVHQVQEDERRDEAQELRSAAERAAMMKEAYAHQMHQPRDTWDPKADEEEE